MLAERFPNVPNLGDVTRIEPDAIEPVDLVVFGSLVAFTAYGWLLANVSTPLLSTYAYVNPVVAVILGMLLFHERFTPLEALASAEAVLSDDEKEIGAAVIDITPPPGLAMSVYGVRTAAATGAHDPLTVRAVAVDDTAIVCADVIGLHEASSARIRSRCTISSRTGGAAVAVSAATTGRGSSAPITSPIRR